MTPWVPTDPDFPKGWRIGCPNGHNSAYTIYGHNFHRCALCGADHAWTKSTEEAADWFLENMKNIPKFDPHAE